MGREIAFDYQVYMMKKAIDDLPPTLRKLLRLIVEELDVVKDENKELRRELDALKNHKCRLD